ncbi:MAG: ROK family protein [Clostridia bacterium]|nr:ROK family protein [Clostridia bacterium]
MLILGFDIGGTKCAVITAKYNQNGEIEIFKKEKLPTDHTISPSDMIERLIEKADGILDTKPDAIGISCGGPLDSKKGLIMSPPNLPGWDNVEIVKQIEDHYGIKAKLQNDANACAMAEWKFGAGKGYSNVIFLTFGTGLGAGLILDGKLYSGTNDNAGELGHIRLDRFGPVGYGKAGSFEGFCSGGGIAQLGYTKALEKVQMGEYPLYFKKGMTADDISAKSIAEAADKGDETAIEVYKICGEYLGRGLSIVIDILNPEVIVLGSIFARSHHLLWNHTKEIIEKEALPLSAKCCRILPAELGESIGDYAAIATALE